MIQHIFYRLAQSVQICMAVAIFLSYGLQFYVPMNIIWPSLSQKLSTDLTMKYGEHLVRIVLVLFTCKYCYLCL